MVLRSLLAVAALSASSPAFAQDATDRYDLAFSTVKDGQVVASASMVLAVDGSANISLDTEGESYVVNASLLSTQGDGDEERLMLETWIGYNGDDIARPTIMINRGGTATYQSGRQGPDGALIEGTTLTVTPVSAKP